MSPYVGQTFRGVVRRTLRRGETIFADGRITARKRGRFVRPEPCRIDLEADDTRESDDTQRESARSRLQTPDTFVRAPLPGMRNATAIVHTSPAGGRAVHAIHRRIRARRQRSPPAAISVSSTCSKDGSASAATHARAGGAYAYVPPGHATPSAADAPARAAVIEKPYQPLAWRRAPALLVGTRDATRRRRCSATIHGSRCAA